MYTAYTVSWVVLLSAAIWFSVRRGLVVRLRQALHSRFSTAWGSRRSDALLFVVLMVLVGALDLLGVLLWPPSPPAELRALGAYGDKPAGTILFFAYFGFWGGAWALVTGSSTGPLPIANSAARVVVLLLFVLMALALVPLLCRVAVELQAYASGPG